MRSDLLFLLGHTRFAGVRPGMRRGPGGPRSAFAGNADVCADWVAYVEAGRDEEERLRRFDALLGSYAPNCVLEAAELLACLHTTGRGGAS